MRMVPPLSAEFVNPATASEPGLACETTSLRQPNPSGSRIRSDAIGNRNINVVIARIEHELGAVLEVELVGMTLPVQRRLTWLK